mgnify:CR=1 FL=1
MGHMPHFLLFKKKMKHSLIIIISSILVLLVVVLDKERITKVTDGSDHSYYLVYTDTGTFKVEDSIVLFRFNSSDVYGKLYKDSVYNIKTVGFRSGFLSEYPNIITQN